MAVIEVRAQRDGVVAVVGGVEVGARGGGAGFEEEDARGGGGVGEAVGEEAA